MEIKDTEDRFVNSLADPVIQIECLTQVYEENTSSSCIYMRVQLGNDDELHPRYLQLLKSSILMLGPLLKVAYLS